jgi:hypothetical protein
MRTVLTFAAFLFLLPPALAITVAINARTDGQDKPTVVGTTNLPDGVELMVTLSRRESSYMAQDKAKVSQGTFKVGPFSQGGAGLNPGTYTIEVSMPLAGVQPPATWPIIGNDGSKLEGPLTKKSKFGGRVAEYKTSFNIGEGKASAVQDQVSRSKAIDDSHTWWLQSCKNTCTMTSNLARKRNEAFDFDRCYYKCVAEEPKRK